MNWGVIGLGKIANTFVSEFDHIKSSKIYMVGSRNEEKAKTFAKKFEIPEYGNYQEVLTHPEVDVVYIACPHHMHFELSKQAMLNGKHVLCEKPITVNRKQFGQLSELANTNKLFLMDAMWTYFLPSIVKAKDWIDEGKIGRIKYVNIDFSYPGNNNIESRLYNPDLAGGALLDIGVYPLYLTFLLLGREYYSLNCFAELGVTKVDESISISLDYLTAKAQLYCSFKHRSKSSAMIYGEKGYIEIPLFWRSKRAMLYNEKEELVDDFFDERKSHGFEFEIDHTISCINQKLIESPKLTHALTYCILETMDDIRKQIGLAYPFE